MRLFTVLFNLLQKRTHIALVFDSNGRGEMSIHAETYAKDLMSHFQSGATRFCEVLIVHYYYKAGANYHVASS